MNELILKYVQCEVAPMDAELVCVTNISPCFMDHEQHYSVTYYNRLGDVRDSHVTLISMSDLLGFMYNGEGQ
ncbi:hypothetical protein VPHD63_0026 [Vibrio phage D63]